MSGRVHDDVVGWAGGGRSLMASRLIADKVAQLAMIVNGTSSSPCAFGDRRAVGIVARSR